MISLCNCLLLLGHPVWLERPPTLSAHTSQGISRLVNVMALQCG